MALSQRLLPAHVTRQRLVAAAPVLNIFRERMVIGVGGRFGYICDERKNRGVSGKQDYNDYFKMLMFEAF